MITSALLAIALTGSPAVADCQVLYRKHLQADLTLSYEAFDQTEGSGFRVLAANYNCDAEAADLIEAYIAANDAKQRSLTWHVAQLRGEAGQYEAAKAAAREVLSSDEAADAKFLWNDHVRAYLAFLEADRVAFERHRAALHGAAERHPGNAMNAKMWDQLAPGFELGYAGAIEAMATQ